LRLARKIDVTRTHLIIAAGSVDLASINQHQ